MAEKLCKLRKYGGGSGSNLDPLVYGMKGIYGQQTRLYSMKETIESYKYFKLSHKPLFFWKDGTSQSLTPLPEANTWYSTASYPCNSYWNMQIAANADVYITFSNSNT